MVVKHTDFVQVHEDLDIFKAKYNMDKALLGAGAFGTVKRITDKQSGHEFAVKIIDKLALGNNEQSRLKYEIDILKNLTHPNIVRLFEIYENKSALFLVTEFCEGTELFDVIIDKKYFEEAEAAKVLKQILQAISYCHG